MITRRDVCRRRAYALLCPHAAAWRADGAGPHAICRRADACFAAIEAKAGGRLGVAVLDTGTGVRPHGGATSAFPMCSTFKLLAVAAVLKRASRRQETLDARNPFPAGEILDYAPETKKHAGRTMPLFDLCAAAMAWSDNTAANLILNASGRPCRARRLLCGLWAMTSDADRSERARCSTIISPGDPRDTTTPNAMLRDLRSLRSRRRP